MPRGDKRGPNGMGPMTGRGLGYCNGYESAGFTKGTPMGGAGFGQNQGFGRGNGRGFGFGQGRGVGYGRRFADQNINYNQNFAQQLSKADEVNFLENEVNTLKNQLKTLESRISDLTKEEEK